MLAGLMAATMISGIAPAYAQNRDDHGQRAERGQNDSNRGGGRRHGNIASHQSSQDRTRGYPQRNGNRAIAPAEQAAPNRQLHGQPATTPGRQNWRDARRGEQPASGSQRGSGWRDDRQSWRNHERDSRQDTRRTDNHGWAGNNWNNHNRRYDERTRWSNQQRWDNGWRQNRRYDWYSYRSRYGDRYRAGRYYAPRGWDYGYRRFSVGIFLNGLLYSNSYWLDDPYDYRLPPAYGTLRWIRYYDDALLVDVRDGYVVDVIHNFFW